MKYTCINSNRRTVANAGVLGGSEGNHEIAFEHECDLNVLECKL